MYRKRMAPDGAPGLQSLVETFLKTYEASTRTQDVARLTALYAESFVFADPTRSTTLRREDLAKALPMRQAFFAQFGLKSTTLSECATQELAAGYCLARAIWLMRFLKDGRQVDSENLTTYVLHRQADSWEILFQLDHQDLAQRATELGLR
jgi:ketosteroid isomerase-like protein